MNSRRFYEKVDPDLVLRSAPAAARNCAPIASVLTEWLPAQGSVLELASGTGEHVVEFAKRFPALRWQPSDVHDEALGSIAARVDRAGLANLRPPVVVDAAAAGWGVSAADAIMCINMVHISPWESALGLLDGSARLLGKGAPLILYGPWLVEGMETAPSNLAFDADLKVRDSRWGLRSLAAFRAEAEQRGLAFTECRSMPANNVMLLFRRAAPATA